MIVWEPQSIFDNETSTSALCAQSGCSLFYICKANMLQFMEMNPGLMLRLRLGNAKVLF